MSKQHALKHFEDIGDHEAQIYEYVQTSVASCIGGCVWSRVRTVDVVENVVVLAVAAIRYAELGALLPADADR